MPSPPISQLPTIARQNSNQADPSPSEFTPIFTRQPRNILPATTNQLQFSPPALPKEEVSSSESEEESNPASPMQASGMLETRLSSRCLTNRMTAQDLRFIHAMATTELTTRQLSQATKVHQSRISTNRTFVDRGGSDHARSILMEALIKDNVARNSKTYLQSVTNRLGNETPVNPNAILGIYHAGEQYFAKHGVRFKGTYEDLKELVPKIQSESTDYLFNNPPTQAKYLIPDFEKILAANPHAMLPLDSKEQTVFENLALNHLIPPYELHSFLDKRASESELQPAKRLRPEAPVLAPVAQTPLIPPAPQGLNELSTPAPLGNVVYGGTTRSSTADVMPIPQKRPNAAVSAPTSDEDWKSLFNNMQKDWNTTRQSTPETIQVTSAPPITPATQSAANILPTQLDNSSTSALNLAPASSIPPNNWNGEQNEIPSQQTPSQFPDIDASIAYYQNLIRRNEVPAFQATSVNPPYWPSSLQPVTQAPESAISGNAPSSNPTPLSNPAAPQPDDWYRDLFTMIDSFPVMNRGASTVNSTSTFNHPPTFNNLFNPAMANSSTGQPQTVWAQPTLASPWNAGSMNAPQFVNTNPAYPMQLNQLQQQPPVDAFATMPGMHPMANSQAPTNFSNNPPFNSSFAPGPLAPSNSFHEYSQLLHESQQQQAPLNMAAPTLYPSMPMNSYSAQQINQYNGPTSNYFTMPATNYSLMPGNSTPATATGISTMPTAPTIGMGGTGGTGDTGTSSSHPYQW